ncbi:MAG: flagellar filament capping protein FliD [Pyrinomonadaceae bacterium]
MATNISFSGLGSGIDFDVVRDAILAQRSIPITQLQSKVGLYNSRIESLKKLNSSLATLTSSVELLTDRSLGTGRNGSTSDSAVATVSTTSQAPLGGFELNVTRIATKANQSSRSFASSTDPILFGGATTATFELQKGGASPGVQITLDSSNNSLEGLRDAINNADAGVTASIVDIKGDGSEFQLVLNSNETGQVNRVELVETTSTGTGADLSFTDLNPPDGDYTKLNAALTINGLNITRSGNTFSDAVQGVTLTLKKTGPASINVTQSNDIENKLRGFVNSYNAIQDFIGQQYQKDANDRPTGVLAGDSTLRNVQQELKNSINAVSSNNGGFLDSLSQLGITVTEDGHLDFDTGVLNEQLKTNPDDVKSLLFGKTTDQTGIFHGIKEIISGLSDTVTGTVQTAITGYQNSVKSLNASITNRLEGINRLRDSLTRKFAAADAAIGQLNNQGTALTNIIKSLEPKSDN